jgi:hypothetical protein
MNDDRVAEFPVQYEGEIALAERSFDLLAERLARGRLPDETSPQGDVYALIDAVGELLHLEALENDGRSISQKRLEKATENLQLVMERLSSWPAVPRTLVIAPLAEVLEEFELEWIVIELMMSFPALDFLSLEERQAIHGAIRRIVPVQVRISISGDDWAPEFEDLLRLLRDMALDEPEDEELEDTLRRGVVYHALRGRSALLEEDRRALADAEPLPLEFADALEEFTGEALESELLSLSLHLVLADLIEAGLVPDGATPRQVATAVFAAFFERDEPEERLDFRRLARWAKIAPRRLEDLARQVDAVFEWTPPDFEGPIEGRHEDRWRATTLTVEFMPARWVPRGDSARPPYNETAARERAAELRDVVWMMIDSLEPVRFISEAFRYGDGAPDRMDEELALEVVDLWEQERLVDTGTMQDEVDSDDDWDDEDEWADEGQGSDHGFPTLVTTDGEPVVFCTGQYEVERKAHREVVLRLDAMEELRREQEDGSERWVWLEPRPSGEIVIASLSLDADSMTVETQSVPRSARVGDRLAEEMGDLIVFLDLNTQEPTQEMLARRAAASAGDGDPSPISSDEHRRVVREMLDQHYRRWPDESVPALGGITPREAVADPEGRSEVIALLRDFEERSRSAPDAMRDFDFGFLWDELGLDRNEPE